MYILYVVNSIDVFFWQENESNPDDDSSTKKVLKLDIETATMNLSALPNLNAFPNMVSSITVIILSYCCSAPIEHPELIKVKIAWCKSDKIKLFSRIHKFGNEWLSFL